MPPVLPKESLLQNHYKNVAECGGYFSEEIFYNQNAYIQWQLDSTVKCIKNNVDITRTTKEQERINVVDLGCGNGSFGISVSHLLSQSLNVSIKTYCVDPSEDMLQQMDNSLRSDDMIENLIMDASTFSNLPPNEINYYFLLMKEMIHHIPDLESFFAGVYRQMESNKSSTSSPSSSSSSSKCFLIITRPTETFFPFFQRIKDIWRTTQPPVNVIVNAIEKAGFRVTVSEEDYEVSMSKEMWMAFIRNRTWSEFSMCTREEMDAGLQSLDATLKDDEPVRFIDRKIFICGVV